MLHMQRGWLQFIVVALLISMFTGVTTAKQVKLAIVGSAEDLYEEEWSKVNQDIKLSLVTVTDGPGYDQVAVMIAAGTPPDILRVTAADMPWLLRMGLLEDITPYIQNATLFKPADLLPINDLYKYEGKQYAINKDWSVDNLLWYNKEILNSVGLPMPSLTQSISYQTLMQQAKKIDSANTPDKIKNFGLWTSDYPEIFQSMIVATGQPLYTPDFLHTTFTTNSAVRDVAAWWHEMFSRGWATGSGNHFLENHSGFAIMGYYFGGHPASAELRGRDVLGVAPTPDWLGSRAAYCYGVGYAIVKGSKNKDEAFKYLEWMTTSKPAEMRTAIGWGAPPVQRLLNRLPQESVMDRQRYNILLNMMPYLKPLPQNPYSTSAVSDASVQPRIKAQNNEISLEQFLFDWQHEADVALANAAARN